MMLAEIALFPQEASTTARQVDMLFFFLLTVCGAVTLLVAMLLVFFAVRFRRRPGEVGNPPETHSSEPLEWFWTLTPLVILRRHVRLGRQGLLQRLSAARRRRDDLRRRQAVDVEVSASRGATRRSTRCTCRSGGPIRLLMTSEDVIHSLFIPDFRIHMDLLPERYTSVWFQADAGGKVPAVLLAVLRHEPRGHDRRGDRDGAGGL